VLLAQRDLPVASRVKYRHIAASAAHCQRKGSARLCRCIHGIQQLLGAQPRLHTRPACSGACTKKHLFDKVSRVHTQRNCTTTAHSCCALRLRHTPLHNGLWHLPAPTTARCNTHTQPLRRLWDNLDIQRPKATPVSLLRLPLQRQRCREASTTPSCSVCGHSRMRDSLLAVAGYGGTLAPCNLWSTSRRSPGVARDAAA
jgi:hypothetical protein